MFSKNDKKNDKKNNNNNTDKNDNHMISSKTRYNNLTKSLTSIDSQIVKTVGYTTKHIIIGIITVIIIIWICMQIYNKYFTIIDNMTIEIPTMKRPFLNLYAVMKDGTDKATNIVFITHHFTRDDCEVDYNKYKAQGIHFLGLSSYSQFPGQIVNPHDVLNDPKHKAYTYDYFKLTRGWCSVFREPINQQIFPKDFPRIQMAESDFANYEQHLPDSSVKKEYDFIYICLKDGDRKEGDEDCPLAWQAEIRSYSQAKKFIDLMCKKYKLKGLLIGRIGCEMPPNCHQLMELTDFQEYSTFIKNYNKCRFIFVPNYAEASCRVCTEAMCFNLPVLMNKNILGGWNYINEKTGEFFDTNNIDTFEPILDKFMKKLNNNEYTPREWFIKNYGKYHSGEKLFNFVKSVFKEDELNIKYDNIQYMKPGI